MKKETVVILGASPKPERYANKAMHRLHEYGHSTLLVNPGVSEIDKVKVYPSLNELSHSVATPIDTLTVYVSPEITTKSLSEILALKPKRVIFNPGTENPQVEDELRNAQIEVVRGCTLVMLSTQQF